MRKNKSMLFLMAGIMLFTLACKDKITEDQLLDFVAQHTKDKAEADEAREDSIHNATIEANVAALNAAGNLLDYTVTLHVDDIPVQGVTVTATNQQGTTLSTTSDENGNAAFTDIQLGGHTIAISAPNYINVSYLVDFGRAQENVHYEIINGIVFPIEIAEASKIELFTIDGMQTATIKGKVEIETDLTNSFPEIPENITIQANFDDSFSGSHTLNESTGSSIYVPGSFTFTQGNIGKAPVDNITGEYSMTVPATVQGTSIQLMVPVIETEQRLGYSKLNGEETEPQIGLQTALFGPDITEDATPELSGVYAEFPSPPPPGRGFSIKNIVALPRISYNVNTIDDFPFETDDSEVHFSAYQGKGYQLTPSVTIDPPDAPGPKAKPFILSANMDWEFTAVAITNGGAGYGNNQNVAILVEVYDNNNNLQTSFQVGNVFSNPDGTLPLGDVNVTLNNTLYTAYEVSDFKVIFFGAGSNALATLKRSGNVNSFTQIGLALGYSTIPTINITGGDPEIPATLSITHMAFSHGFEIDNSGITQSYVVLPLVSFEVQLEPGVNSIKTDVTALHFDEFGYVQYSSGILNKPVEECVIIQNGLFAYDEDFLLKEIDVDKLALSTVVSFSVPQPIIVEPEHYQAKATVVVNSEGKITGLTNIETGSGYTQELEPSLIVLEGLPGAGAAIKLINFTTNLKTGEVTWNGDVQVLNGGANYTNDVNIDQKPFSANTMLEVHNGETKIVDINYGTGARKNKVE